MDIIQRSYKSYAYFKESHFITYKKKQNMAHDSHIA